MKVKQKTLKKYVKTVGYTIEGKPTLGGAFFCNDTMGLPLASLIEVGERLGAVISLHEFVLDALKAGWSLERARKEIIWELKFLGRFDDAKLVEEKINEIFIKRFENVNGTLVEFSNGDKGWFLGKKFHRIDGPAVELTNGYKEWWIDGERMTKEEFEIRFPDNVHQSD